MMAFLVLSKSTKYHRIGGSLTFGMKGVIIVSNIIIPLSKVSLINTVIQVKRGSLWPLNL